MVCKTQELNRMSDVRYFMLAYYLTRLLHQKRILISSFASFYAYFTAIKAARFTIVLKDYSYDQVVCLFPQKTFCVIWLAFVATNLLWRERPFRNHQRSLCLLPGIDSLRFVLFYAKRRGETECVCVSSVLCDVLLVELWLCRWKKKWLGVEKS